MSKPPSPLSREHWQKTQETLARVLKGEAVPDAEIPDGMPEFDCVTCSDTAFVVEEAFDGTKRSKRCPACRSRVDSGIKAQAKHHRADAGDEEPPTVRDFKQAAGLDRED